MNTYACWYHGLYGFCFQHPRSGWWFVPEQGQPDADIHRHLRLEDLLFVDAVAWRYELQRQRRRAARPWWQQLISAMRTPLQPHTVAGLLLLPVD